MTPLPVPAVLTTRRLAVRAVEDADLDDLLIVNGDDEVTRHLPYPSWRGMHDAQAWLARMRAMHAAGLGLQFVIADRRDDKVVGSCLLHRRDEGSARAELGYVLGRAHWGQGIMREALGALLDQAFDGYGLRRIEAEVNPANTASTALLGHLGFTCEGLLRQRWSAKGQTYDTAFYGLLRDEWPRR